MHPGGELVADFLNGDLVSNYLMSLIRTAVPAAVGAVLSWLALRGLNVPASDRESITAAATFVVLLAYYAAVRALEKRWPKLGVLLGVPAAPSYAKSTGSDAGSA